MRYCRPHQRTAVFVWGCAWAQLAPGSSSSGLLGWCWSPSAHSPAFQKWPTKGQKDTCYLLHSKLFTAVKFTHISSTVPKPN